jgi:glycosyltransferase involved in cell wall biosynthesis
LRILFVTWDGPQVSYLQSLFLPIFEGLKPHGIHFDILQFRWGTAQQEDAVRQACEGAGFGYKAIRVWRWGGSAGPFASAVVGGARVRRAIRRFKSDLVMPRSILPSLAVLAGKGHSLRPVLLDSDGLDVDERVEFGGMKSTGPAYRILRDVEAQMVRRSRATLVRSPAGREVLMARAGPTVSANSFFIVSNGRDQNLFTPGDEQARQSVRAEVGVGTAAPLVIYVGSIGGKYRTDRVGEFTTELLKLRPDTRLLVLTGSIEEARAELFAPFPELKTSTTIFSVDPAEVPRFIAAADIGTSFITPSFSMRAAAPIKTAEYLLCGVPVVGAAQVGDPGAALAQGVFFDDRCGLAEAAQWVVSHILPDRVSLRERARQVGVENFSLEGSIQAYLKAVRAASGSSARSAGRSVPKLDAGPLRPKGH